MTRHLLAAVLAALALALGACGGDEPEDSGDAAEAKQTLIDACHEKNPDDPRDLAFCRCIADRLEKDHGYDTAREFDDARESVDDGDVPREVQQAGASPACAKTQQ